MRFAPKRVRLGFTVVVAMATMVKDRTQVTVFEIGPATDEALITGEPYARRSLCRLASDTEPDRPVGGLTGLGETVRHA